jgi:chromate transporter
MPPTLRDLALIFLRLGFTAFGGPAAHIAMMQREFVERRAWITRERYLDMLGAVNLIPGPNSTELAIGIGMELAGRPGLLVAGVCFIGPAFLIVLLLASLYVRFGTTPDVASAMSGVKPVVLAIIAVALWNLGRGIASRPALLALAGVVMVAGMLGVNELVLLLGAGAIVAVARSRTGKWRGARGLIFFGGLLGGLMGAPTLGSIFLYFLYVGSVLYGSGYVLIAFLRDDLVGTLGWLSERQLLDAIAIGQVTPGPLFTTATFVGYLLAGTPGSIAATVGIFLPSFLFVLLTHRWIAALRARPITAGFLDGVNAGALGLIAVALLLLGRGTLLTPLAWILALGSLVVLLATRINATWLIAAGGVIGWIVWR